MKQIMGYLAAKGIPKPMVQQIRQALTWDAVQESKSVQMDRIYCGVARMLWHKQGFDQEKILESLEALCDEFKLVLDEGETWEKLQAELADEMGLAIRSERIDGEDRFVVEYLTDEERENYRHGSKKDE